MEAPTIGNVLKLFSKKLEDFTGESKRSYQKAFSSFQLYTIGNYSMSSSFDNIVIENWVVDNIFQGLTRKTVSFYLEKISSLYTGVAHKLIGGKEPIFKDVKKKLKELPAAINYSSIINRVSSKIHEMVNRGAVSGEKRRLVESLENYDIVNSSESKESLKRIWACLALKSGVLPNVVKSAIGKVPSILKPLQIVETKEISENLYKQAAKSVAESLKGEEPQWFAMRLRPKVKFEGILERFSLLGDTVKMPEFFYPSQEIAKKVGRKMVWTGKPVIRDVVFFKTRKCEIYPLFTNLYDLAWCYRTPGGGTGNYAVIPDKAMEEFKNALGFLNPDFEVMPTGQLELKPGDKVVIVDGEYAREIAEILKKPETMEDGNTIYRVSLLNQNGHWDIGIDARLLKKQ